MIIMFILILLIVACVIGALVLLLATSAILFAKGAFALLAAWIISQQNLDLVPNSGFLNFLAWAIICFFVIYFLSILPRVDIALRFSSTFLISLFITYLAAMIIGSIFIKDFKMTVLYEAIIKIICIGISAFGIYLQGKKFESESSSNPIVLNLDRLLASLVYGFSLLFLFVSLSGSLNISITAQYIIVAVVAVVTFIADIFFAKKLFFGYTPSNEVVMPK